MKTQLYTVPALFEEKRTKKGFLAKLFGRRGPDEYYEAQDPERGAYLLWMECERAGQRRGYPCLLRTEEGETLCFAARKTQDSAANNIRLTELWEALELPARLERLQVTRLEREEFFERYRAAQAERE